MLPVTIADVKFLLKCEIARKQASGCYDTAAAIEFALATAIEHWNEYDYKDDCVIHRQKEKEGAEE